MKISIFLSLIFLTLTCKLNGDEGERELKKATFAGGCFWCMQHAFDELNVEGNIITTVGYMGGKKENPTSEEVSSGKSGHAEAIEIEYDANIISYAKLLDVFWKNIDPTVKDRQFCDIGNQYRSAIFYHDEEQKKEAEKSKEEFLQKKLFKNIYTEIVESSIFYPAEEYHQKYYLKHPWRYKFYYFNCGRKERLSKVRQETIACPQAHLFDGKKFILSEKKWKRKLTPEEFNILREKGTEAAYKNEFYDKKDPGIYLCKGCNLSLFSSKIKFDSKTGWPSFFEPICPENIALKDDYALFLGMSVEVVCPRCESHLGHVFDNGPSPTGKRYCINSLALKFLPE